MAPRMNGLFVKGDGTFITDDKDLAILKYELGMRFVMPDGNMLDGHVNAHGIAEPSKELLEMIMSERMEHLSERVSMCTIKPLCVAVGNHSGHLLRHSHDILALKTAYSNFSDTLHDIQYQISTLRTELRQARGVSEAQFENVHKRISINTKKTHMRLDIFSKLVPTLVPDWSAEALS